MKSLRFVNIGYGNVVASDKVVCVVAPDTAPIKRLVLEAKEAGRAIDATYGRKTRAVIITGDGYVLLTPLHVETVAGRLNNDFLSDEDQ